MSKLKEVLSKLELLKNYDNEIKNLEALNKTYSEIIVKSKKEIPIGMTLNYTNKNLSIAYNSQVVDYLLNDLIVQNKCKIKSLKSKITRII